MEFRDKLLEAAKVLKGRSSDDTEKAAIAIVELLTTNPAPVPDARPELGLKICEPTLDLDAEPTDVVAAWALYCIVAKHRGQMAEFGKAYIEAAKPYRDVFLTAVPPSQKV